MCAEWPMSIELFGVRDKVVDVKSDRGGSNPRGFFVY